MWMDDWVCVFAVSLLLTHDSENWAIFISVYRLKERFIEGPIAVSYTHLDVYKRQL